jgi:alpha-galactosidase
LPWAGTGYLGAPVIEILRAGVPFCFAPAEVQCTDAPDELSLMLRCSASGLRLRSRWRALHSGVIVIEPQLVNEGASSLPLLRAASLVLPLPRWVTHVTRHAGRWSAEMQVGRSALSDCVATSSVSRGGRTGFAAGQWLIFEGAGTGEEMGRALGLHIAWSGDVEWHIETDVDGDSTLWIGARVEPGELEIAVGEYLALPHVVLAPTMTGRASLRHALHRHVRREVLQSNSRNLPRKVHLNTWEACGFAMSPRRLEQLIEQAAALGVERFVLDDGWFGRRRDDSSSLGDWWPSLEIFPHGLERFIEQVHAHGLDFGLWIEPEMVSPDSQLFRAHPDWCLHVDGLPQQTQRRQLVLDLSRPEVFEHLFATLDALLRRYSIAYLKWDHNRELFPLAGRGFAQTRALYALLDRLRAAHPLLEIETCASGGGRVDYALMTRCARFWASDNNDALERLRINRAWLQFLPTRSCGSHVGPSPNPITGRILPMDFRARVAMFGHLGIEADPAAMNAEERDVLARHIALYKQWREVIHEGDLFEIESDDEGVSGWFVVHGTRALALVTQARFARHFECAPIRLSGLDPQRSYRVSLPEPWPQPAARYLADSSSWRNGRKFSGTALAAGAFVLPLRHPATAWLVTVEAA